MAAACLPRDYGTGSGAMRCLAAASSILRLLWLYRTRSAVQLYSYEDEYSRTLEI
eukprot:SAG25_NODE_701_length_5875_cov_2.089681_1_plen_55_part_00